MNGVTPRSRATSLVLIPILVFGLSGCVLSRLGKWERPLPPEPSDVPRNAGGARGSIGPTGVGWKTVSGKREPRFLLAADGTECMVPRDQWAKAQLGSKQFCVWTERTG